MADTKRIASRIRQARQRAGMTQEEAARRLGVSGRTYIRWEHGDSEGFMSRIDGIASAFGTTPQELIDDQSALLADLIAEVKAQRQEIAAMRQEIRAQGN